MKHFLNSLLVLIIILNICSCKTQADLKKRIYTEIDAIDNNIDNKILKDFSMRDSIFDIGIQTDLNSLNNDADQLKNHDLRKKIKTYTALANKIVLLHEDTRMNYTTLGQILGIYTQSAVDVKEKLAPYKVSK
ncbi:hypothetical protein [Mucilaginibacter jinjuensis]|uniref:Uncharacterized protein n=1 Tax=Mucilaginibacter jinjuensis TaxID=1176721 RepID=A0ABY7TA23_9SPHI|nr:hypothetical protein [Mucilaginibacter jinjuensis]WCT13181.1 hypothetical protein PQO05_04440 [Mucilaginibacter jinjuensis]